MAKKSKNVVTINWEEEEGMKFLKDPGEYVVKVTNAILDEDDEGKQFINWTFEVVEGKKKGSGITTKTYITPKALWKLRELLECMGIEIGNSVQDLDLDSIVEEGEKFVIEVEEGKERPDGNGYYLQVSDYMPYADYKEASNNINEPEEDVKETSKKSKKSSNKELEDEDQEEDDKPKKKTKKSKEVDEEELLDQMEEEIDELGLDIDLDDYDTFEEKQEAFEKAKKKAKKSSKKEEEDEETQTYTVEEIEALGTKQLRVIAEEIGLELDDEASTRSKRRSVIQALRKAGLLEE